MESWRSYLNESGFGEGQPPDGEFHKKQVKYLEEDNQGRPKVIFMSGAPGVGKSYIRKKLGLDTNPKFQHKEEDEETGEMKVVSHVVDPDQFYVPMLKKELPPLGVPEEEFANVERLTTQYREARQKLKQLLSDILNLQEPEKPWSAEVLEEMYEQALRDSGDDRSLVYNLEKTKQQYDVSHNICSVQGKCFSEGQKQAKKLQQELFDQEMSMIIDGTGGFYSRIINQKEEFERAGYDVAMVFVDAPLEMALGAQKERERKLNPFDVEKSMKTLVGGTYFDPSTETEVTKPSIMKPFVNRYGKEKPGYEKEFGDNYFYVINDRKNTNKSITQMQRRFEGFLAGRQLNEADWQKWVKANYNKQVGAFTRGGKNKTMPTGWKKAPIYYHGSAPPGGSGG